MKITTIDQKTFYPEFVSAKHFESILSDALLALEGEVWLIPNLVLREEKQCHNIDILMLGYIHNYACNTEHFKNLCVKSFCAAIEVKSHPINKVSLRDNEIMAEYSNKQVNVSKQSINNRLALINNPIFSGIKVVDLIYYDQISKNEINILGEKIPSNVLCADTSITNLWDVIGNSMHIPSQDGVISVTRDEQLIKDLVSNLVS